jgi:hypothetical protein
MGTPRRGRTAPMLYGLVTWIVALVLAARFGPLG